MEKAAVVRLHYTRKRKGNRVFVKNPQSAYEAVREFYNEKEATISIIVYAMYIHRDGELLAVQQLGLGSHVMATVDIRKVVTTALMLNADSIIITANRNGNLVPIDSDNETIQSLGKVLEIVNIGLLDFIIIKDRDYISLADNGNLAYFTNAQKRYIREEFT